MAKYIVIEDFEAQWLRPPLTTPQIAVFKKDSVIQALPYPGGTLKTRVDGTQPSGKEGEILVDVVESKVKMLPDEDAEKLKKDEQKKKIVQYAIYGAGALFLWWFIYGKNRKKTKTLSGAKDPNKAEWNVYLYINYYGDKKYAWAHKNAMPVNYKEIIATTTAKNAEDIVKAYNKLEEKKK